jgi:hypothetical protein
MYVFLDYFFFAFHTAFTLFNILGWAWRGTRKWHLVTMTLTALSWFVLGIWYGWGYCACTDWHWDVRRELGYRDQQSSYIHFLVFKLTGANLKASLVETATLVVFFLAFGLSVFFNMKDRRRSKRRIS